MRDQLRRLLARYLAAGATVVVAVLGPGQATAPATDRPALAARTATASADPGTRTKHGGHGKHADRSSSTADPTPTGSPTAAPTGDASGTAADARSWGTPTRTDDFAAGTDQWQLYGGTGYAGNGRRSPSAVSVRGGVLTITGDSAGTTEGMCWGHGRRYGRWASRVRAPAADPAYHAVVLLWPDAGDWPKGGEIDLMEMSDPARQTTGGFVHYGADNRQLRGSVATDASQWHAWAVDWSPSAITMYLDGRPWFRTADRAAQPPGPMHLCLQLDWYPSGDGPVRASSMQVDWVREYAPDPAGRTGSTRAPTGTAAPEATPTSTPIRPPTRPPTHTTAPSSG